MSYCQWVICTPISITNKPRIVQKFPQQNKVRGQKKFKELSQGPSFNVGSVWRWVKALPTQRIILTWLWTFKFLSRTPETLPVLHTAQLASTSHHVLAIHLPQAGESLLLSDSTVTCLEVSQSLLLSPISPGMSPLPLACTKKDLS